MNVLSYLNNKSNSIYTLLGETMKKYALFFDIDGTIATYQCPVSQKLKKKILHLKNLGHKIFICTGRGYSDIPADITALGFNGYICSTGAFIITGGQIIHSVPFPCSCLQAIYTLLKKHSISAFFEGDDQLYRCECAVPLDPSVPDCQEALFRPNIYSVAYHLAPGQDISPLLPYLDSIRARAIPQTDHSGDIIMPGCNKAAGMRLLLEHCQLKDHLTIAIGDSPNDIEMLKTADLGIAMGHAPEILKKHADMITGTFEEDGAYMALERIF